jgi:hypothetical protein
LLFIYRRNSEPTITALAKANSNLASGPAGSQAVPGPTNDLLSSDTIWPAWITVCPTTVLLLPVYWFCRNMLTKSLPRKAMIGGYTFKHKAEVG